MKPPAKIAYRIAIIFIFLSPFLSFRDHRPSAIQTWPMYVGKHDLCTLRFSDPQGEDPNFHQDSVRRLNWALFRQPGAQFILRNEKMAAGLLNAYCKVPSARQGPAKIQLECFKENMWTTSAHFGGFACEN